ncbi:MAG: adenylate/guanylate cyclase domain-containing protein [Gemmatimonadetes bacterium]|nr:adenylate/guanylate cyclase domain-containing protein [Gemmatimonadota bacterium]
MADAKRRLAGILSADVAGYSRLMGDDERATMETLNAYRDVFRRHVSEHDGRVVDTSGDSVLALFDSIVEALQCAVDVQGELEGHNADLPEDRRMRFRIGINLGDIFERDDGTVYGNSVNVAARLESLAEPGGIWLSGSAHEQVEGKTNRSFEDVGTHAVKNIARPVGAFRVTGREAPAVTAPKKPLTSPGRPSIAVLPFDNLSGDPEQEYFADGMAEDLITALSRIRWLFVIARNSTFTYKGQAVDVKRVGQEMGVRYVLEGSVRKGGDRVRITAQLIDATTGNHIWAKRYDRKLADIFAIQDELTEAIAGEIEPELAEVERERAHRRPPDSLNAWDCYQRGLWHMWQLTGDENAEAQRLLQRAADIDPGFAPAFAGLAYSHYLDVALAFRDTVSEDLEKARQAALRAVAIDVRDATAHCTLGRVYTALGDYSSAVAELEAAIDLNPSFALAHYGLAVCLMFTGRSEAAIPEYELAEQLSPHDPYLPLFQAIRAGAHSVLGQFQQAEEYARRASRHPRASFWAYANLAAALAGQGKSEQARAALNTLLEMQPDFSLEFFERLWPNTDPTFLAAYFDLLREAGLDMPDEPAGDG